MKAKYTKAISGENLLKVIQSALIILWIYLLRKTNAYHIVYLYCGILGCLAALVKCAPMSAGQKRAVWLVSGGLSLAIGLANGGCIDTALGWALVLSGGFVVWERLFLLPMR